MVIARKLSASLEDYLEAIHQVIAEKNAARAKDIADRLGVAASSVTNALRGLVARGLVNHAPYDSITLTAKGGELAERVVQRHEVLTDFFTKVLAVDNDVAASCACKMEHVVPDVVLQRLIEYIKFEERCTLGSATWIDGTGFVCNSRMKGGGHRCGQCSASPQREGHADAAREEPS